jgi:selenoprotein W-related protein
VRMVEAILGKFEHYIQDVTVIPSRGGVFEVIVGDNLVFSKKELGRHAEVQEVLDAVDAVVGPIPEPVGE